MFTAMSKKMMIKSFKKTKYTYQEYPELSLGKSFGIYVHVPFCFTKCTFCPFYKELFSEEAKNKYLTALLQEIESTKVTGKATWLYFGGGTPNTLKINELKSIVDIIRSKVSVESIGIELLPSILDKEYLIGLKDIGYTKISVGVESFSANTLTKTGRKIAVKEHITTIVKEAHSLGLWVNIDLMVGLPEQTPEVFMEDITHVLEVNPDQVTIYPFMELGKIQAVASLPDRDQFKLIEDAYAVLHQNGFARKAIWVFAKGEDIYDTSRDELIDEYLGFGPAGFSTFGTFKVVNPELDVYLKNSQQDKKMALVAPKDKMSDEWRIFARMVYDLAGKLRGDVSFFIKLYVFLLKTGGYIRCQKFTKKGVIFSHTIVKTVVENLPYPLQNVDRISNYEDYLKEKEES